MKNKFVMIGIALMVVGGLQGCLKKDEDLSTKQTDSNDDRKVELLRWKRRIDTEYKNCVSVPGREAACKKEFEAAMAPYLKEQAKSN